MSDVVCHVLCENWIGAIPEFRKMLLSKCAPKTKCSGDILLFNSLIKGGSKTANSIAQWLNSGIIIIRWKRALLTIAQHKLFSNTLVKFTAQRYMISKALSTANEKAFKAINASGFANTKSIVLPLPL